MKEGNRLKAQERLNDSNAYKAMEQVQKLMDTYYLDGVIGLLPFGIGDILAAFFAVLYVWFAVAKVRSIPLSLAIINNSLRDVALGLIPFTWEMSLISSTKPTDRTWNWCEALWKETRMSSEMLTERLFKVHCSSS